MSAQTITRREFLRVSALAAAGVAVAACAETTAPEAATVAPKVEPATKAAVAATATPAPEQAKPKEAPGLADQVSSGKLPPLEERIGSESLVVVRENPDFTQEIGTYGGTLSTPRLINQAEEYVLLLSSDTKTTLPNIAKAWSYSEDGKTFTLYYRKDAKWSDGDPFTTDDTVFWWEDVQNNQTLTASISPRWKASGEPMQMTKVDDFTVELLYAEPRYYMHNNLDSTAFAGYQGAGGDNFFLPRHYLEQYHIQYNAQADELAKKENLETWDKIFLNRCQNMGNQVVGVPVLNPWVKTEDVLTGNTWDRNPYYFKVDPEGNQLPYVDKVVQVKGLDQESHLMKMLSGENDYEAWGIALADWPMLSDGQEKGGYDLWMARDYWTASPCLNMNPAYDKDPEIQKLLSDKRFRQALSMAIDRNEILEKVFLGRGEACAACPNKEAFFYKPEWATKYAEYDPDKANSVLDDLGISQRDEEGFRTNLSGGRLEMTMETTQDQPSWVPGSELVKSFWEAVGVRTILKVQDGTLMSTRQNANEIQVMVRLNDKQGEKALLATNAQWLRSAWWAPPWYLWYNSKGEKGIEPPDSVKHLYDLCDQVGRTPPDKVTDVMHEIFDTMTEEVYLIGTIGYTGKPAITSKKLGNVDKLAYGDCADNGGTRNNWAEIVYWKQ
jgi:peptide/nickel transport system substrate-binding protein